MALVCFLEQILSAVSDEELADLGVSDDYLTVAGGILSVLKVRWCRFDLIPCILY